MIALRHPWFLLLVIPLLVWAWRARYRWGIPSPRPSSRLGRWSAHLLPPLLVLVLGLAATGPEWRSGVKGLAPVVDFALVLDGSSSMLARDDGQEDRWSAARRLMKAFIVRRQSDRFALVLFSAHPVTLSPLSADHLRLWRVLENLSLDARDDGTAIGSALMTAVRRLSDSPARSRVVILLTDGAQNRGRVTPAEAAEEARTQGIRIHTVLLGRPGGESLYPIDGGGYARLKVDTDPETLKQVAQATGGEALAADDPTGLARSFAAIDRLERTALPVEPPSEGRPLAHWFLIGALALAVPLTLDLAWKRGRRPPAWLEGRS